MRDSYIIVDPCHVDALPFVTAMAHAHGMQPICLYQDPKERYYAEQDDPRVRLDDVEASLFLEEGGLEATLAYLTTRFNIRAVIPWDESYVGLTATMLDQLDVDWIDGETLSMFRDKRQLKETIAARDATVRLPRNRLVRSIDDVVAEPVPAHVVIKPNDGMGSLGLGYFSANDHAAIAEHLGQSAGPWILEERIDGPEFRINGLIRRDGTLQVLLVTEYLPIQVSKTVTLAYPTETQLRTTDERWPMLVDYASRLLAGTGLRGSAFHLEVKVDERGPALIDVGARLASDGGGWTMSMLHPDRPDVYAVAARDLVGDNDFALDEPDYRFHDAGCYAQICGVSSERGTVVGLSGVDEVEAMPEFLRWIVKPRVGQSVSESIDLATYTYIAAFRHRGDRAETLELQRRVYDTVQLEVDPGQRPFSRTKLSSLAHRSMQKSGWIAHRLRSRLGDRLR